MQTNFKQLLTVLILITISRVVASKDLTAVVTIDRSNGVALNAIRMAFEGFKSPNDNQIKINEVLIGEEDTSINICEQIFRDKSKPTYILDVTESPQTSPKVKNLVREMGIPTISTTYQLGSGILNWRNLDDVEKQYLIHVSQPGDTLPLMVKDMVLHYNYKTLVVYYDNSFIHHKTDGIADSFGNDCYLFQCQLQSEYTCD